MNYWTLHKKSQLTFTQKIQQIIFGFVKIDQQHKNIFEFVAVVINYALSYAIVFLIIFQSLARQFLNFDTKNPTNSRLFSASYPRLSSDPISNNYFQAITIIFLIRLAFAISYIFIQKLPILIISKLLLIVNIFLTEYESTHEDFIAIELPLFVIDILMITVWSYKIERRIKNFDSRLHFRYPLIKQFTVYLLAVLIRRVQKMTFSPVLKSMSIDFDTTARITLFEVQALMVIVFCLGIVFYADYCDFLYNSKFKRILMSMDVMMVLLLVSWLGLHVIFQQILDYFWYLALTGIMVVLSLAVLVKKQDFDRLYSVDARNLEYQSENWLLKYFESLRKLIKRQNSSELQANVQMMKFIEFHRSSCLYAVCPFTRRFNVKDSIEAKAELIQEYMIKQIQNLMGTKPALKKYLVHYLSPNDKVYRYLNQNKYSQNNKNKHVYEEQYIKRELHRLAEEKKDLTNEIKILQAEIIKDSISTLLSQYLISAKRFYSQLNKQIVNIENVALYGNKILKLIDKIEYLKENYASNFTQDVRMLINNFTSRLVQYPKNSLLQNVIDPPFLIQKTTETCPTFIISAEPENFLSILDANIACSKQFYFRKQEFIKLTVLDLLPGQIKDLHLAYFNKISEKISFDGMKKFPKSLYVTNKNGYKVFFIADIYSFYSIGGRIWCVAIQISHRMKSIILIAKQGNGKVIGISQMAVFHGFTVQDKGKQFTEEFFTSLLRKSQRSKQKYKKKYIEPYVKIFGNSDFYFLETKTMQIIQENTAFGFTYYLVEVKSEQQNFRRDSGLSSLSRTIISTDQKSFSLISDDDTKIKPKTQFHFHSDGVVRMYKQEPEEIKDYFNGLVRNDQDQEMEGQKYWEEGIVEMRLMGDKIDFLENIETENQFMAKPLTKLQKKLPELNRYEVTQDFFKQCLKKREQETPKWLIYLRIGFVIIVLVFLSGEIFMYATNIVYVDSIETKSKIMLFISNNQLNLINLSKFLLGYKVYQTEYLKKMSFKQRIANTIAQYEQNSKRLYDLDPSINDYFTSGPLQKALSKYFITLNYLSSLSEKKLVEEFEQQPVLKAITSQIAIDYSFIISKRLTQFSASIQNTKRLNLILIIFLDVFTFSICLWTILAYRYVQRLKNELVSIMSKIPDKHIEKQLVKLELFEEYLYFGKDIYCQDDVQYIIEVRQMLGKQKTQTPQEEIFNTLGTKKNGRRKTKKKRKTDYFENQIDNIQAQTNHQILTEKRIQNHNKKQQPSNTYIKKVIQPTQIKIGNIIVFLWTILIILLNYFELSQFNTYYDISQQMVSLSQNLQKIQSDSDSLWLLLNQFPYNKTQIDIFQRKMYNSVSQFKQGIVRIKKTDGFDENFMNIILDLWTKYSCKYIEKNTPNCTYQINGALNQGANQIIAYLNRKYDRISDQQVSKGKFQNSSVAFTLSNLQLYYFPEIRSVNQNLIFEQHALLKDKYERVFFAYFIAVLVCFGVIAVIYKLIARENESLVRVEQFFKLIEFESLKKVKEFKLYIKETYYDEIFK